MDVFEELEQMLKEYRQEKKKNNPSLTYDQVGEFINSQEFVELLAQYKTTDKLDLKINSLIGIALDYADIFRNSGTSTLEEMKEILNGVVKRDIKNEHYDIIEVYEKKVRRDLGLNKKESLTREEDDTLKDRIIEILAFERTRFHAFNGNFLESIKENGVNPNTKACNEEYIELNELHRKYGKTWKESIRADMGHVSYSGTASVSYRYAQTSPEWFNNMSDSKFSQRDYEGAKAVFEEVAQDFSEEDRKRYMELFETCWSSFAGNKTYVAIVPDVVEHDLDALDRLRIRFLEYDSSFAFKILASSMRSKEGMVNLRTDKAISVEEASFVELPNLEELKIKVEQIINQNQTLEN